MDKKTKSLGEAVAVKIKNSIFKEQIYEPGDQMPIEQELADQLKVSRTALREGIKLLESEGILIIRRGVGTFVSRDFGLGIDTGNLTNEEVQRKLLNDWYEARLIWEVHAMPLVAERATEDELADIENTQDQLDALIPKNEDGHFELDQVFHNKLIYASHNRILQKMIDKSGVSEWSYYVIA